MSAGTNYISLIKNRWLPPSLRSRRLDVVGTRKNGRARRHARGEVTPCVSPSRARVLSFAHYFQAPATQATGYYILCNNVFCFVFAQEVALLTCFVYQLGIKANVARRSTLRHKSTDHHQRRSVRRPLVNTFTY